MILLGGLLKMKNKKRFTYLLFIMLMMILFTACSNASSKNNDSNNDEKDNEAEVKEVTLSFAAPWGEEMFDQRVKSIVEEEFPHITMELESTIVDKDELEELFAKEIIPDILLAHRGFGVLNDAEMTFPLDEYVDKYEVDLDSFAPGMIEALRDQDPENNSRLLGLPIEQQIITLFYNKEIFDKAGLEYPTDGITWEETIELAKKLTGERDGVNIRGLVFGGNLPFEQLSQHGTDPETGEVLFTSETNFTKWLSLIDEVYSIPGNYDKEEEYSFYTRDVAMWISTSTGMISLLDEEGLDFDLVTMPSWSDNPGVTRKASPYPFTISPYSENKEEAFQVLQFLTSKDPQTILSRAGSPSTLADKEIHDQYAADLITDDREFNTANAFSNIPAESPLYSQWDANLGGFIGEKVDEFIDSNDDVNTFLRKMEDEYKAIVEELKAQ